MTARDSRQEGRKARTRRTIQQHAVQLFAEQGYEATTVNQIAAAAGVSHMTFFRHFPTKEDVVLTDEYDPMIEELLRARPLDEPVLDSLTAALAQGFARIYGTDREVILERTRLIVGTRALRARLWDQQLAEQRRWEDALVSRGVAPFEARVLVAAFRAAVTTALIEWVESGGADDLPQLMEAAIALLRTGLTVAPATTGSGD